MDWKRFLLDVGRGMAGMPERSEAVGARQMGVSEDEFKRLMREAAETQQALKEAQLSETVTDTETKQQALREASAAVDAYGGAQPAMTQKLTGGPGSPKSMNARPTGEFDRSEPGAYIDYPATTAEETAYGKKLDVAEEKETRLARKDDWDILGKLFEQEFKVGKEERLTEAQEARIKYQQGMLDVARRSVTEREKSGQESRKGDEKFPNVTKGMHALILKRAENLMEGAAFEAEGEFEGLSVGEWILKETEAWEETMAPKSALEEFEGLGGLPETPVPTELQPEEPTVTPPIDRMPGLPGFEGMPMAQQETPTVKDIPDETIRQQVSQNWTGSTEDFERLVAILEAEGIFDGPEQAWGQEIARRLGPFAQVLFDFQDQMEQDVQ